MSSAIVTALSIVVVGPRYESTLQTHPRTHDNEVDEVKDTRRVAVAWEGENVGEDKESNA